MGKGKQNLAHKKPSRGKENFLDSKKNKKDDMPQASQPASRALIDPLKPKVCTRKRKMANGSRSSRNNISVSKSIPKRTQGLVGGCGIFAAATADRRD